MVVSGTGTVDLTGATLTPFDDDAIAGDKVEGGTINANPIQHYDITGTVDTTGGAIHLPNNWWYNSGGWFNPSNVIGAFTLKVF